MKANMTAFVLTATSLTEGALLVGCSDSFMRTAVADKRGSMISIQAQLDAAGNVTGAFDPSSGSIQTLRISSGALSGAALAIPPGALSLALSVTVGEGETLASSSFTQQLGLSSNTITAGGPSISFIPSSNVQASSPFTLSLPLSALSLALDNSSSENLVVMYRWMKVVNGETSYVMGILPRKDVTVAKDKVSFQIDKFGVFQVGVAQTKISDKIAVPTVEPPNLKSDATNPLVGHWGMCRIDDGSSNSSTAAKPLSPIAPGLDNYLGVASFASASGGSASSSLDVWSGLSHSVHALAYHESGAARYLYVGGEFGQAGNVSNTNRLARLNLLTKKWESVGSSQLITDSNSLKFVKSLVIHGQWLYVAGSFQSPHPRLFKVDLNTREQTAIPPPTGCDEIAAMKIISTNLVVGCNSLTNLNLVWRLDLTAATEWAQIGMGQSYLNKIIALESSGSLLFAARSDGEIAAIAQDAPGTQVWASTTPFPNAQMASLTATSDGSLFLGARDSGAPFLAKFMKIRRLDVNCANSTMTHLSCLASGIPQRLTNVSNVWITGVPSGASSMLSHYFNNCTVTLESPNTRLNCYGSFPAVPPVGTYSLVYSAADATTQVSELSFETAAKPALAVQGEFLYIADAGGVKRRDLDFNNPTEIVSTVFPTQTNTVLPTPFGVFVGGSFPNSGCISLGLTPPAAHVTVTTGLEYKLLVELDDQVATDQFSTVPMQNNVGGTTFIPNASFVVNNDRIGRTVKLKAPDGCYFRMEKTQNGQIISETSRYFGVEPRHLNRNSGACMLPYAWSGSGTPQLRVICDGSSAGSQGGQQNGGGNDSFGRVSGATQSLREAIKITAGNFLHLVSRFNSTDCSGVMASNLVESGTYTLPTRDDTTSILLDGLQTKVVGSLMTDDSVAAANQAPQSFGCGLSGWTKGNSRDLSTTACADDGQPFFARMRLEGGQLVVCGTSKSTYVPVADCVGSDAQTFQKMP
jgi:hypothetical protein